jgi:hypothetical protein
MKKVFLLATAVLLVTSVTFAGNTQKKKCCHKSCCHKSEKAATDSTKK